jgi:hypothetical protein
LEIEEDLGFGFLEWGKQEAEGLFLLFCFPDQKCFIVPALRSLCGLRVSAVILIAWMEEGTAVAR